ncbi:MAG TPA: copper homeostasis membrane protein CopD [Phenylobacterium sp.]|nr:copper homeostasis membrane protein CopD [Phenylobacterium sp.]
MDPAVVAARLVQFPAAVALFGTPLFLLYGARRSETPPAPGLRGLFAGCAGGLLVASVAALCAQTAVMAGDPAAAFDRETLTGVLTGSDFGTSILIRLAASAAALVAAAVLRPGRGLWTLLTGLGGLALGSLAWSGHGAAEDGAAGLTHAAADIVHLLAAGVWLGALVGLALLLSQARRACDAATAQALHDALAAFSGIGAGVVALIVASGLVNSWFLVGPRHLLQVAAAPYGRLLLAKLAVFVAMLGLAAANRYRLAPSLAKGLAQGDSVPALQALRLSLLVETAAGLVVLLLVSVLGVLAPVAAQ